MNDMTQSISPPIREARSHEVLNQPPALEDYNPFDSDQALREAVVRGGAAWACDALSRFGARLGQARTIELGAIANKFPPVLNTHDRFGRRRDEVEFHPAWHGLMTLAIAEGLHTAPWADSRSGSHVARAAAYMLYGQVENGTQCPLAMTYAAIPVIRRQGGSLPWLQEIWLPRLLARNYDRHFVPVERKTGALVGMGMTEKQGGSDVRANTTTATPVAMRGTGQPYRITGHKFFLSAPMCDAFLVLAQAPGGLSCFFMPRFTPDGELNTIRIQRLKDKLGDKSNATSEVEFFGAQAWLLGDEGRGVPTILEMGIYTRLDCANGTASLMRQALTQALHHAAHRSAFGKALITQPLMQNVLADLAIESEAATALVMRLARAFDGQQDEGETNLRRLLTPAVKYWICKRGATFAAEAMEVLGGSGYVEESVMPRIYRQIPLNSIWEGSGNIMCLDVLRAARKAPAAMTLVLDEIATAKGADARLDQFVGKLATALTDTTELEARARQLTQCLVLALQGALLVRFAPHAVADAFCASRLVEGWGGAFGTLPRRADARAILARAWPNPN